MKDPRIRLLVTLGIVAACSHPPAAHEDSYAPGLGEIMGQIQLRHAKLWFAGASRNWPLAAYELDEIHEAFTDAVHYHPTHKTIADSLNRLVPGFIDPPLAQLDSAVRRHDAAAFVRSFDALTAGCNGCHQATEFGFNVVQRPTTPPFSNQSFEPPAPRR